MPTLSITANVTRLKITIVSLTAALKRRLFAKNQNSKELKLVCKHAAGHSSQEKIVIHGCLNTSFWSAFCGAKLRSSRL